MTETEDITVLLTDSVLELNHLEKVMAYLRESTGKQVTIADYKGRIYSGGTDHFLSLPDWDQKQKLLYHELSRTLYYRVGSGKQDGFIIVAEVDPPDCAACQKPLEQAALAVKTYLSRVAAVEAIEDLYFHNFITDILLRNINIKDLMKHSHPLLNLDLDSLYYVTVMEPGISLNSRDLQTLHSYTKEWLANNNLDIFCTIWDNQYLVLICPTHYDKRTLEVEYGWDRHLTNIKRHYADIRDKFNYPVVFGIGNKYTISQLHRSYREALFALHLSKLTGRKNGVRHISDLGIFSLICNNELADLKQFCNRYLGSILAFDTANNRDLLETLRCFFDADLDSKETADRLHLHINSFRYRLKKIEELSGLDLQKMEDRTNLFAALKVYEMLLSTGFIKE